MFVSNKSTRYLLVLFTFVCSDVHAGLGSLLCCCKKKKSEEECLIPKRDYPEIKSASVRSSDDGELAGMTLLYARALDGSEQPYSRYKEAPSKSSNLEKKRPEPLQRPSESSGDDDPMFLYVPAQNGRKLDQDDRGNRYGW